jgi:ABC-type multidrug transport system fused ATPase/permease subunit
MGGLPDAVRPLLGPLAAPDNLPWLAGALVGVILVKNLAMVAAFVWQVRLARRGAAALAARLTVAYLAAPMDYHLPRRNAQYVRGLRDLPEAIWFRGVLGLCNLVAEAAGVAALAVALAVIEPLGVGLAVLFLSALVAFNHRLMGRFFQRWGRAHAGAVRRLYELGGQVFANIKLVKASGAEPVVGARLDAAQRAGNDAEARRRLAQLAIRPVSEIAMLAAAIIILVAALHDAASPAEALPLLAVFGFGAVRLLPAINRISMHVNELKFTRPALAELEAELAGLSETPPGHARPAGLGFSRMLEVRGLAYRYPGAERAALEGVSFRLARGEVVGIAGASGAGKSTLVDAILGLVTPQAGEILADGAPVRPGDAAPRIGYAAQGSPVIAGTIRENVAFGVPPEAVDEAALAEAIEAAQLGPTVAALPAGLETQIGEFGVSLSGGQRQRVALARALYGRPALVVLDEATSDLDMATEAEIGAAVERLRGHCTILIVAHRLHLLRRCDRILFLGAGRVVAEGSFDELARTAAGFRRMVEAGSSATAGAATATAAERGA